MDSSASRNGEMMLTRDDLDALGTDLLVADDAADPLRLAAVAWRLYSEAGIEHAEIERLHAALRSIGVVIDRLAVSPRPPRLRDLPQPVLEHPAS